MSGLAVEALTFRGHGPFRFDIAPGACTTLTGPSGAGKTLLLRALVDLDPHEGVVRLDGVASGDVAGHVWRSRLGMLPAESGWWGDIVGEHFSAGVDLTAYGFERDVVGREVSRLSTGERQRLALARLLAAAPLALVLDEPTSSLDPENVAKIEELLASYRTSRNAPVLWVTHDRAQAERVGTSRLELADGRLEVVR